MCGFYTHMIGVKFHHIKIWEVQFFWELKIDLLCKMCKMGAIMLTLLQEGDLQNTDLSSDDTQAVGFKLEDGEGLWGFAQIGREWLSLTLGT